MCLTRNSFLTADIAGGFWKMAPCKVHNAFSSSLRGLSPGIGMFVLRTAIYSLPALCCDFTNRVALSRQTIRHPVTLGSSVPEWPVFSTFSILLTHATTSWDDGFEGLSRFITPYLRYSVSDRFSGALPFAIGVQCPSLISILSKFFIKIGQSCVFASGVF